MANPFHDSDGRFCSKGEMQADIQRLVTSGQQDKALALMADLKTIEESQARNAFNKDFDGGRSQENVKFANNLLATLTSSKNPASYEEWSDSSNILENIDKTLNGASDAQLDEIGDVLTSEKKIWQETMQAPALKGYEAFFDELKEETGFESIKEFTAHVDSIKTEVSVSGINILSAVEKDARDNGLPAGYSNYFFSKAEVEFGLAPEKHTNFGVVTPPVETPHISVANFKVKVADKSHKAIIKASIKKVLTSPDKIKAIAKHNDIVDSLEKSRNTFNKFSRKESEARQKLNKVGFQLSIYSGALTSLETAKNWRKTLRIAGIKTDNTAPTGLSSVNGSHIAVDESGKVSNLWVVNKTRRLDKIVSASPSDGFAGGFLTGASGKTYSSSTHYHSYKSDSADFSVIIDETVKGKKPYDKNLVFRTSIDSGD